MYLYNCICIYLYTLYMYIHTLYIYLYIYIIHTYNMCVCEYVILISLSIPPKATQESLCIFTPRISHGFLQACLSLPHGGGACRGACGAALWCQRRHQRRQRRETLGESWWVMDLTETKGCKTHVKPNIKNLQMTLFREIVCFIICSL